MAVPQEGPVLTGPPGTSANPIPPQLVSENTRVTYVPAT